jgi:predicted GNAT family N-acyltransferase
VLDAAEAAAREAGARLLWCNARSTAVGFYAGRGWQGEGAEFIAEGIPHLRMTRALR